MSVSRTKQDMTGLIAMIPLSIFAAVIVIVALSLRTPQPTPYDPPPELPPEPPAVYLQAAMAIATSFAPRPTATPTIEITNTPRPDVTPIIWCQQARPGEICTWQAPTMTPTVIPMCGTPHPWLVCRMPDKEGTE